MSIAMGLLALLTDGPKYGYQLRQEFEEHTSQTWPLNIGQVYTTLARFDRDGWVIWHDKDDDGQRNVEITDAGREVVRDWFGSAVQRSERPRDELAIKFAMALLVPGVDIGSVIQTQRSATMRSLQGYTRLKSGDNGDDLAWVLILDSMIFQTEAEIRWLDHVEQRIAQFAVKTRAKRTDAPKQDPKGTPKKRRGRTPERAR